MVLGLEREPDLLNRDPNELNKHLGSFAFEELIAEPDDIHSIDCCYRLSFKCFNFWKNLTYKILTFWYGIFIAAYWGCEFAVLAFYHIWFITPFYKDLEMQCLACKRFWSLCIHCCFDPCFEACGLIFDAFRKS